MRTETTIAWLAVAFLATCLLGCGGCASVPTGPQPIPEPVPPADMGPIPEPPPDVASEQRGPKCIPLPGTDTGSVTIHTFDMAPPKRAGGKLENFVLALRGPGIKRMAVINMANNNRTRSIRLLMQSQAGTWDKRNAHSNYLPGWHTWRIEWEPGESRVYLDGKLIGKGKHRGQPTEAWAGTWDGRRWWPGVWRGLKGGDL